MPSVLEDFGLSPEIDPGVLRRILADDSTNPDLLSSPAEVLKRWLQLLPRPVFQQINLALGQERPFMPPDVTPEMMAEPNTTVPSMNHIEIIYRCIDFALKANDFKMAAALVYVVDRACYRFGQSSALLRVVDEILCVSRDTPVAPQVILRQARVMKDSGDLHTAMRVLEAVISGERKWDYKNREQYENTTAVCVQIKGQILHNLGLWKEAIPPLVQSVQSFRVVNDNKGTSSSLALLSRCLKKLGEQDYGELRRQFFDMFPTLHPCYEAYQKGLEAVQLIQDLGATVYVAHNQLLADESLLMFTIQQLDMPERQKLDQYQVIVEQMKRSLASHRTVHYLHSLEVFLAFVRAVFMISLTLQFSPVAQDTDLARFLEKLSLELYAYMCSQPGGGGSSEPSASLSQNQFSVRLMNSALALLGLHTLQGSAEVEQKQPEKKWSEVEKLDKTEQKAAAAAVTETSSSSKGAQSSDNTGNSNKASSSTPPSSQTESSEANGDMLDGQPQPSSLPTNKARTFPAAASSRFHGDRGDRCLPSRQDRRQTYVGLTMNRGDLLGATCPALAAEVTDSGGDGDVVDASQDVESLLLSADSIASASVVGKASDGESGGSVVDQSGTTQNTSSATTESSAAAILKKNNSGSATVDQSVATKSTSTDSREDSSSSSGLSPSGSSNLPSSPDQSLSSHKQSSSEISGSKDLSPSATVDRFSETEPSSASDTTDSNHAEDNSHKKSSNPSATVDRSSETEPSSTSSATDPGVAGQLSPLVDVSSACGLMSDLELGDSVKTSDSSEFLAHFTPFDDKDVHRAVLMIYTPVTGQWSAQTTLAYLGPVLDSVTKGANRDAFHVSFLHQDEPLGRYVGKRYRRSRKAPEVYMQDVVCQMLAGFYVTRFNQALQHCPEDILQVQFLSAAHLQLLDKNGKVFDWINVEPFLHGSFLKLTNNLRYVSKHEKDERGVEVATALSHFSYTETGGSLMMVDLQGWIPADGKGVVYLTDPVFHTRHMKQFSSGDRHQEGMKAFWTNQHPKCNRVCQYLGLDKTRPDVAKA